MTTLYNSAMPISDAPQDTISQQAVHWLVRLRSDDLTEDETYAFADWLSQDARHSQAFAAAEDTLNDMAMVARQSEIFLSTPECNTPNISPPFAVKQKKPFSRTPRYPRWLTVSIGLAAAWLFALLAIVPEQAHLFNDYWSDYHSQTGELRDIALEDGSHLLLNTNTAVSVNFTHAMRQIILHHGQARFSVAPDHKRPFEVVVNGLAVQALGTVFEVYQQTSGQVRVIVEEHAVAVRNQGPAQTQQTNIREGQQLLYRPGENWQVSDVDIALACAWQRHALLINDRPLKELALELERYHVGRVFIANQKLENMRVTGVFPLDNPNVVLESIRKVLGVNYSRLGPWVVLHG